MLAALRTSGCPQRLPSPHRCACLACLACLAGLQGGAAQEDAEEFLSLTQQLAVSSAYGAVQCSYGACLSMQQHSGSGGGSGGSSGVQQQPDVVLLARFEEAPQLQRFLDCPPVAALLEVGRGACGLRCAGWCFVPSAACPSVAKLQSGCTPSPPQQPPTRNLLTTCRATTGCRCARCGAARCRPPPATAAPAAASSRCFRLPPAAAVDLESLLVGTLVVLDSLASPIPSALHLDPKSWQQAAEKPPADFICLLPPLSSDHLSVALTTATPPM